MMPVESCFPSLQKRGRLISLPIKSYPAGLSEMEEAAPKPRTISGNGLPSSKCRRKVYLHECVTAQSSSQTMTYLNIRLVRVLCWAGR